ncbi:Pimeloyl-ACP methyl ester carboxylesterase [Tindallia magadiensis]|uniref:Pimeloyl-ACP methyl ester carboxylesterase n=1 Tax=Tindallia magadiensis TaxID=69895 RepID=A0A1I3I1M5_9FIRM|nr:alpha/beta hydrolase [Tindallia magadiensis]SFI41918.1 Pimeloyl-ACP methyl ester carboxylesterase [Tindallia magadiensis]
MNKVSKEKSVPGNLINVNGHKVHIYATGRGTPTVILVSGASTPSPYTDYYPVYKEISKIARTIVYERPGYGWSEIANTPRTTEQITKELHLLLEKIKENGPYIFVAHSYGALEVIKFAQEYSNEVAGIVLIDGVNPKCLLQRNDFITWTNIAQYFGKILRLTNIIKLLDFINPYIKMCESLPDKLKEINKVMIYNNLCSKNMSEEVKLMIKSSKSVIKGGNIGDIPLLILTSQAFNDEIKKWKETQRELKEWSRNSKQIIVGDPQDSSKIRQHYMHWYKPKVLNDIILEFIRQIQQKQI